MNSKQFDTNQQKIKNYYNQGMITEEELKESQAKLLKEWYSTPKNW